MSDFDSDNPFGPIEPDDASDQGDAVPAPVDAQQRQLALVKQGHRYVFHYTPGQECELLERLASLARDPSCTLGMFDVAVLSHQLGRRLNQQVEQLLKQ